MAKIVCVLYDDPTDGYPESYARDSIPEIKSYPDGQVTPRAVQRSELSPQCNSV
jgi:formate dehydrogenase